MAARDITLACTMSILAQMNRMFPIHKKKTNVFQVSHIIKRQKADFEPCRYLQD